MSILLIRPKERIEKSCQYLQQQGIDAVGVALQRVEANLDAVNDFVRDVDGLSKEQLTETAVLVVSPSAAGQICDTEAIFGDSLSWFAVGKRTAATITEEGARPVHITTPEIETSEGLLALPQLQDMSGKRVFIVKGSQGRTLIEETLKTRGAEVFLYEVYKRIALVPAESTVPWQQREISLIVATSTEAIQIAWETYPQNWLISTPWLVVSRRLVEFAAKLGINNVMCSAGASDKQLNDAIKQFLER